MSEGGLTYYRLSAEFLYTPSRGYISCLSPPPVPAPPASSSESMISAALLTFLDLVVVGGGASESLADMSISEADPSLFEIEV